MKLNVMTAVAAGALMIALPASADFTGLDATSTYTALPVDGSLIWVVQVFATFDDPTDRLLSITGAEITSKGSPLYQNPFGAGTEPNGALIPLPGFGDLAYDSFVTMNKETTLDAGPATALEPGSAFSAAGFTGGWFTDGDAPQTTGQLSYLIAQLSVEDWAFGNLIIGDLTVAWKTAVSGAFFSNGSFAQMAFPAPGAVALLALGGLAGSRRRR